MTFSDSIYYYVFTTDISFSNCIAIVLQYYITLLLFYGGIYYTFYQSSWKDSIKSRKFNEEFPNNALVSSEMLRCFRSTIFIVIYDIILRYVFKNNLTTSPLFSGSLLEYGIMFFIIGAIVLYLLADLHFYVIHRILHLPIFYKNVHEVHHWSKNTDPWSGLSFHWIEAMLYFSSVFIVAFSPFAIHPVYFVAIKYGLLLSPLSGHLGYEISSIPPLSWQYHHYLHHIKYNWNFGASPLWDILLGTHFKQRQTK